MSHNCGTVQTLGVPVVVGPDTGTPATSGQTWEASVPHVAAPTGTKFVILHFTDVTLPASNRLEVDLGYDMDVFTSADGSQFWTRPVDVSQVGGGSQVLIRYITDGAASGAASVDRYGRGESLQSHAAGHDSITNCDPFLPSGWVEPVFPHGPGTTVPKYDPFWICDKDSPPEWENVRCAGPGDAQFAASRSVGMIVTVHAPSADHAHESVSTCSVTLIDSDLVLTAGHCVADHPFEVPTSSVTFDYEVDCSGNVLPAYGAVFYKVRRLVKYRYSDGRDYAILQLRGEPPYPTAPVRNTMPSVGEQAFGVHHPNGAVKKTSPSATGSVPILNTGNMIGVSLDVAGGSSGSGLFDVSGSVLGVAANGGSCGLSYSSAATMLDDPILIPDPPEERAVMLVMDRSGSMSESAGVGAAKATEARDAAELFISMMRAGTGNQAGLVSFASNASSPVDFAIAGVTPATRQDLIDNVLPSISPGGRTSIGDGLAAARDQFGGATPPQSILVLTDGMENEPAAIADVGGLEGVEITAIGFGTESNLDGERLTDLAQTHGGFYKRAGSGLELRKFFALAFGEIFEAGALADPEYRLPADVREGPPVPFDVCGEEAVTVIVGWDTPEGFLDIEVRTPDDQVVDLSDPGVDSDSGRTWRFVRIALPYEGERDGTWTARVRRTRPGGEFPPPEVDLDYFVNINATGGPTLRPLTESRFLYTGDVLHPKVMLSYPDESVPRGGTVTMSLRRPARSVGTALADHGLGAPRSVAGDVIPARQATLMAIEEATGNAATDYIEEQHELTDDSAGGGTFMPAGRFGKRLVESLVVEGNYTFHTRARLEVGDCAMTREVQWTYHVKVGIDPDATDVDVEPTTPDGEDGQVTITITPRDRYGNHVGPGQADDLDVNPLPGCELSGVLTDLGDGRYAQQLICTPGAEHPPGLVVGQDGRDPVVLVPPSRTRTIQRYVIPMFCGTAKSCCGCASTTDGTYATAVHVTNGSNKDATVEVRFSATELAGAPAARWPDGTAARGHDQTVLTAGSTTLIDCCAIEQMLLGGRTDDDQRPQTHGVLEVRASGELDVSATYTTGAESGSPSCIHVEVVEPRTHRVVDSRPPLDLHLPPANALRRQLPPPRPQDVQRKQGKDHAHK